MKLTEERFALFKLVVPAEKQAFTYSMMLSAMTGGPQCDCEDDESCEECAAAKSQAEAPKRKRKKQLCFVAMVTCPAEVANIIRKAPLDEYVILRGQMSTVKVAMPVFMDGKNLDTLTTEWSDA